MSKRIYINEQQLEVLVNYIQEGSVKPILTEETILTESFRDWAIAGLMTLATIGGVKAQTGEITPDHLKAAHLVQDKLAKGDTELTKYFTDADIELNKENLKKLMSVDSTDIHSFKTKNPDIIDNKLKKGYAISDVTFDNDTIWEDIPQPAALDSLISLKFDGNVFESGGFNLNQDVSSELDYIISKLANDNINIVSITVESSTDTEPIEDGGNLFNAGVTDNQKLAEVRGNTVIDYLKNLGADNIKPVVAKPEQGPDVYSTNMSREERISLRDSTEQFRYVKINIVVSQDIPAPQQERKVSDIIEKVQFELIKEKGEYDKPVKRKGGGGSIKITKQYKCKVKTKSTKEIPCYIFTK